MRELVLNRQDLSSLAVDVLSAGGSFTFRATGFSMRPFIYPGDILTVELIKFKNLKIGHIVLFRDKMAKMVVHRVVRKIRMNGELLLDTMGDASIELDGLTCENQVVGRVIKAKREGQILSLDNPIHWSAGLLWAKLFKWRPFLFTSLSCTRSMAATLVRSVQSMKVARKILKALLNRRITYAFAGIQEAQMLSRLYGADQSYCDDGLPEMSGNRSGPGDLKMNVSILAASWKTEVVGALQLVNLDGKIGQYDGCWIWGMHVRNVLRGAGIGEGLMIRAEKKAREKNAKRINLIVFKNNRRAINLYKKIGFKEVSIPAIDEQLKREDPKKNYRVIMSKKIDHSDSY